MKKLALTFACVLATGAAFAQGTVNWNAILPTAMTAQVNTADSALFGGTATGGTSANMATTANGYYFELLYTSYSGTQATISSLSDLLSWSDTGLEAANSTSSAGKLTPINPNAGATVPWDTGTTDSIVLVGWSANLGSDWATVSGELAGWTGGGYFGVSATGYINPYASGSSPGASIFATGLTAQGKPIDSPNTQLYALPVPEPATIALAGLSGLSLLLFRRRKA